MEKSKLWTAEKKDVNVHVVRIDVPSTVDFEQWFLLRSDAHHDSVKCNRKLEKEHLDKAVERNAGILDFGDCLDAMQGPHDKRASKSELRPEHKVTDYFNAIVRTTAEDYAPYAKNWVLFGYGNHESSAIKNAGVDLLGNLTTLMNYTAGTDITTGGYAGYVRFQFKRNGGNITSRLLKYHHGSGGGGPVTGGMIQAQRMAVYVTDADYVCQGHYHESWHRVFMKEQLVQDVITHRPQYHLSTPGYKEDYNKGKYGWAVEKGLPPKPKGAVWLRFYFDSGELKEEISLAA